MSSEVHWFIYKAGALHKHLLSEIWETYIMTVVSGYKWSSTADPVDLNSNLDETQFLITTKVLQ